MPFNGIGDLGSFGGLAAAEEQALQQPLQSWNQNTSQQSNQSTSVDARATGGSISNSANVASRIGDSVKQAAAELPWAWVLGAVGLTGLAAYLIWGQGIRLQNPVCWNPPRQKYAKRPKRQRYAKLPKRRRNPRDDSDDDDSDED